jgi:hypothetical protein
VVWVRASTVSNNLLGTPARLSGMSNEKSEASEGISRVAKIATGGGLRALRQAAGAERCEAHRVAVQYLRIPPPQMRRLAPDTATSASSRVMKDNPGQA